MLAGVSEASYRLSIKKTSKDVTSVLAEPLWVVQFAPSSVQTVQLHYMHNEQHADIAHFHNAHGHIFGSGHDVSLHPEIRFFSSLLISC